MAQPLTKGEKPTAFYQRVRDRIDLTTAVDVLNAAMKSDKPLPAQKVQVAMFSINKLLPSMQAVAVQVEHKVAASWADIQAKALESGIDPLSLVPGKQLISKEKTIEHQDDSEGGLPPETQP